MRRTLISLATIVAVGAMVACGDSIAPTAPTSVEVTIVGGKSDTLAALGATVTLSVTVHYQSPPATQDIPTWASSNLNVVTITQGGVATAVGNGSAVVSATVGGVRGTITLTVNTQAS